MAYAVEARAFRNGMIVAKKRAAENGEMSSHRSADSCEIWIDVFESEKDADGFLKMYKRG